MPSSYSSQLADSLNSVAPKSRGSWQGSSHTNKHDLHHTFVCYSPKRGTDWQVEQAILPVSVVNETDWQEELTEAGELAQSLTKIAKRTCRQHLTDLPDTPQHRVTVTPPLALLSTIAAR